MKVFQPNLAGKVDLKTLRFPVLESSKIEGLRMTVHDGVVLSRSMKPLPNLFLQRWVAENATVLVGVDGEIVVGSPNHPDVFNLTTSAIRRTDGEPDFTFWVFDLHDRPGVGFYTRHQSLLTDGLEGYLRVRVLPQEIISNMGDLDLFEAQQLALGYEGVMVRAMWGEYKQGRSTTKEGGLLKLKRYEDAEAVIVGVAEKMHNDNVAFTSETGHTKRSTHAENLTPAGTMGALTVLGINGQFSGTTFNIGTGFDDVQRKFFWDNRDTVINATVTYKFFPPGSIDAPRHPVFKGLREGWDQ